MVESRAVSRVNLQLVLPPSCGIVIHHSDSPHLQYGRIKKPSKNKLAWHGKATSSVCNGDRRHRRSSH